MQDQVNPYAPPKAVVRDAATDGVAFDKASRGSRLGAALLDGAVGFLVAMPILIEVLSNFDALRTGTMPAFESVGKASAITSLLSVIWIVVTIVLVSRNAQTIGKKLVGIKVARSDGSTASLGRIFWLRNVVNFLPQVIPVIGYIYGLVDILFIFGERQQCLHDRIADTIVIRA